ncbi:uncharacterized protein LOC131220145 [Magnolia sinica]|uniref:uncharacterized protein LOC131220145 n=1 Tax=Magnolia sinica TaxID=86752 RepID=UPI002657E39E|nr:uncharacterized protein LOC131220145 [Magnolia sinica]
MDGSSRGNPGPSRGGGICRSENGNVIFAFAVGYGVGFNNLAEFRVVWDGLVLCFAKGLSRIVVELDSKLVVDILNHSSNPSWIWRNWSSRIDTMGNYRWLSFQHVLREGNIPADSLAKLGSASQASSYFASSA